jgi:predicted amidohydrolase/DNA-binding NarL/FixJ family response regulator
MRVMVAATNPALRAGLRALLASDEQLEVVAEARDLSGWADLPQEADVLVLAAADGLEAALGSLLEELPPGWAYPAVLLLSDEPANSALTELGLPAWGILPLEATAEELVAAVGALGKGLLTGAPHLMRALFKEPSAQPGGQELAGWDPPVEALTAREGEVLQLLAQGLANKQIALSLGISEHTVKFHVSAIYAKQEEQRYARSFRAGQSGGGAGRFRTLRAGGQPGEGLPAHGRGRRPRGAGDPVPGGLHPRLPARFDLRHGGGQPHTRRTAHLGALLGQLGGRAGAGHSGLGEAARQAQAYLAIGVIERDSQFSRGTLYCTLLYFGPDGSLLGKHRKLKPTAAERLIWGEGDGSTLEAVQTEFGVMGGLICWENYMPLARMAMYEQGVELYLAPTADAREVWQSTLRHVALEGRCFVLGCNQFVTKDMYPADLEGIEELESQPQVMCRGGSAIISPLGEVLAGPLFDEEGILYADLDLREVARGKFDFDVVGQPPGCVQI